MKKLSEWVEKSFINKTIFVLFFIFFLSAIIYLFAVIVPRNIEIEKKKELIDSDVVYISKEGTKYHLFKDCSDMYLPVESFELEAAFVGYKRCRKCYDGVEDYYPEITRESILEFLGSQTKDMFPHFWD